MRRCHSWGIVAPMLIGIPALDATDWSRLVHAYGRATDTPEHLRSLLIEDAEARGAAMQHLWSAIIHQGTVFPATAPVALVILGLLDDARLDAGEEPVRAELLLFLTRVVDAFERSGATMEDLESMARFDLGPLLDADDDDAIYEDEDASNALHAQSVLACVRVAPFLTRSLLANLDHADARVRMHAAMAATAHAASPASDVRPGELVERLTEMAMRTVDVAERCSLLLALGELNVSLENLLSDAEPSVRLCAAMAPSLARSEVATRELRTALEQHAAHINDWFPVKPPQLPMQPRFTVVQRLLERVPDFDLVVDAAVAVARTTKKSWVDFEWGPLLVHAFPSGDGVVRTEAQRRFLAALVDASHLWDPRFGNAGGHFRKAGLPYEREACARLVSTA
ncbi:hypothetical protein HNV27_23995 [Myxococcus xanthus]|nr:hypothetical protein [Myxococcus xanthus]